MKEETQRRKVDMLLPLAMHVLGEEGVSSLGVVEAAWPEMKAATICK